MPIGLLAVWGSGLLLGATGLLLRFDWLYLVAFGVIVLALVLSYRQARKQDQSILQLLSDVLTFLP
jgi:hypothetical protein